MRAFWSIETHDLLAFAIIVVIVGVPPWKAHLR
jgi:hypothetical protein